MKHTRTPSKSCEPTSGRRSCQALTCAAVNSYGLAAVSSQLLVFSKTCQHAGSRLWPGGTGTWSHGMSCSVQPAARMQPQGKHRRPSVHWLQQQCPCTMLWRWESSAELAVRLQDQSQHCCMSRARAWPCSSWQRARLHAIGDSCFWQRCRRQMQGPAMLGHQVTRMHVPAAVPAEASWHGPADAARAADLLWLPAA